MTTSVVCNRRLSTGRRGGQLQLASAPYRQSISCHFLGGMRWLATSSWWTQSSQIGQVFYHGRDGHAPAWILIPHTSGTPVPQELCGHQDGRQTDRLLTRYSGSISNPQSPIRNPQSAIANPQSAIVSPWDSLPVGAAIPSGAPLASCACPPYGICPSGRLP